MVRQRLVFKKQSTLIGRSLMSKLNRNSEENTLCVFYTVQLCLRYSPRDPRLRHPRIFKLLNKNYNSSKW